MDTRTDHCPQNCRFICPVNNMVELYSFTLYHFIMQVLQTFKWGGGRGGRSKLVKDDVKTAIRKQLHMVTGKCCV